MTKEIEFERAVICGCTRIVHKFKVTIYEDRYKLFAYKANVMTGLAAEVKTFKELNELKKYLAKIYEIPAKRFMQLINGETYEIGKNENGEQYIKFLFCGMKSYHPKDVEHKYCGNCHKFL